MFLFISNKTKEKISRPECETFIYAPRPEEPDAPRVSREGVPSPTHPHLRRRVPLQVPVYGGVRLDNGARLARLRGGRQGRDALCGGPRRAREEGVDLVAPPEGGGQQLLPLLPRRELPGSRRDGRRGGEGRQEGPRPERGPRAARGRDAPRGLPVPRDAQEDPGDEGLHRGQGALRPEAGDIV